MRELFGEFKISERDISLRAAAERYVRECEQYDRSVCTGPMTMDGVMPAGPVQRSLSVRNSRRVLEDVHATTGFPRSEIIRAAATIDLRSIQL